MRQSNSRGSPQPWGYVHQRQSRPNRPDFYFILLSNQSRLQIHSYQLQNLSARPLIQDNTTQSISKEFNLSQFYIIPFVLASLSSTSGEIHKTIFLHLYFSIPFPKVHFQIYKTFYLSCFIFLLMQNIISKTFLPTNSTSLHLYQKNTTVIQDTKSKLKS